MSIKSESWHQLLHMRYVEILANHLNECSGKKNLWKQRKFSKCFRAKVIRHRYNCTETMGATENMATFSIRNNLWRNVAEQRLDCNMLKNVNSMLIFFSLDNVGQYFYRAPDYIRRGWMVFFKWIVLLRASSENLEFRYYVEWKTRFDGFFRMPIFYFICFISWRFSPIFFQFSNFRC